MIAAIERQTSILVSVVAGLLAVATIIGFILSKTAKSDGARRTVDNLNARTKAWWVMALVFGAALVGGNAATCALFGLISFLALREMLTLAPTRRGDHHTLFWAFFVITPLQYYLITINWYGFFTVFIPVYSFIFLAIRSTLTGDYTRYMERIAKVLWGVLVCVYFISHAPALLMLDIHGQRDNWKLLAFLIIVVQLSDVLQYVWGKLLGRRKLAPHISPNKTWEGFIGGVLTASLIGMALYKLTPFTLPIAFAMSLTIALTGFFGGIVMSAVKRDVGIKDFGHIIQGHGGMLDRVDSITFAAPVFFHLVRWWYTAP